MSESLPAPLISPAPLVTSDEGKRNLKTLVDGLLDRQVPDGQRKGSFNAVANSSYYFDYTAPLALLSAYKHSDASPEQKEQYAGDQSRANQRAFPRKCPLGWSYQ